MKKVMICILSIIMCFGFFGCGGNQEDAKTINVAAFKGAYGDTFWKNIKTEFEAQYAEEGYKIEYDAKQNIEDTISPQIKGGEGPDVIYLPMGQEKALTEKLIKSKGIVDISSILDENVPGENVKLKDKIIPGFLNNFATNPYGDDKTYMLPLFYSPLGVYYNKALFNADGSEGKYKLPQTWDDMYAFKASLDEFNVGKKDSEKRYLFAYPNAGYMTEFIFSSIASNAGKNTLDDFLKYEDVYTKTEFKQVFKNIENLKGYVYPSSMDIAANYKDNQNALLQNRALFMPGGTWLPTEMEDYTPVEGFEYGFMAPPKFSDAGDRYAHSKIEQVYISSQSEKQDIAKKFIAFLFSDKATNIIARDAKSVVPTVNALDQAKENNYLSAQILSFFDIYKGDAVKLSAGDFAPSNVPGLNWKQVFYGNVNEMFKPSGISSTTWISEMREAAAKLKAAKI